MFGGLFSGGGAQQVADGGELGFGLGRSLLLFYGFDDGVFFGDDTFAVGLGFDSFVLGFVRSLVLGSESADEAAAFFFGAFGVGGDEVFEDLFIGDILRSIVGVEVGVDLF